MFFKSSYLCKVAKVFCLTLLKLLFIKITLKIIIIKKWSCYTYSKNDTNRKIKFSEKTKNYFMKIIIIIIIIDH